MQFVFSFRVQDGKVVERRRIGEAKKKEERIPILQREYTLEYFCRIFFINVLSHLAAEASPGGQFNFIQK